MSTQHEMQEKEKGGRKEEKLEENRNGQKPSRKLSEIKRERKKERRKRQERWIDSEKEYLSATSP